MLIQMLSGEVLAKLDAMDDYDRMLAYERIGREYGMSAADVETQFNAWKSGRAIPSSFSAPTAPIVPSGQAANYIADASRYRPTYDPSKEGRSRQSQIEQAVMCPLCHSALGIPSTRPIKITCPSCMSESTFTN